MTHSPTSNTVEPQIGDAATPLRIAFLGPYGTFTEEALWQVASPEADLIPCTGVPAALESLRNGQADRAVVPIENSVEGGVNATLDSLAQGEPVVIVSEMIVPVRFVLACREPRDLKQIQQVCTHPHAWAQCRKWVSQHLPKATHVPATSTAAAAEILATLPEPGFEAVLCNLAAARRYGLHIAAENIADNPHAVTRFVMAALPHTIPPATGADKTSLQVRLPDNEAGALLSMLEQFSARGVNLSRIESRPVGDTLGSYSFSIDLEGHISEERVQAALIGLHRTCPEVRFMGSYPRVDAVPAQISPGTTDQDFLAARDWISQVLSGKSV